MVDGIDISREDAEKQIVPDDLNSLAVGSYIIPNPNRRRTYGYLLIFTSISSYVLFDLTNWLSVLYGSLLVFLFGIFVLLIDNAVNIKQSDVISHIMKHVPNSIGYYSIALTFSFFKQIRFLKPIWTVIVYDHENPPKQKTIVEIDAANGDLVSETYTESIKNA